MLMYVSQRDVQRLSYIIQYSFQGYAQQFQTHPNNFFMSIVSIAMFRITALKQYCIWKFGASKQLTIAISILAVGIDWC